MLKTQPITLQFPAPAAGADWSIKVSQIDRAVIMSVTASLTSAVAAGNRTPGLTLTDQSGLVYCLYDSGRLQAASTVSTYTWAQGVSAFGSNNATNNGHQPAPLPDVWLSANDTIGTTTNGLMPADQWSAQVIRFYTGERWLQLQRELAFARELEA